MLLKVRNVRGKIGWELKEKKKKKEIMLTPE